MIGAICVVVFLVGIICWASCSVASRGDNIIDDLYDYNDKYENLRK